MAETSRHEGDKASDASAAINAHGRGRLTLSSGGMPIVGTPRRAAVRSPLLANPLDTQMISHLHGELPPDSPYKHLSVVIDSRRQSMVHESPPSVNVATETTHAIGSTAGVVAPSTAAFRPATPIRRHRPPSLIDLHRVMHATHADHPLDTSFVQDTIDAEQQDSDSNTNPQSPPQGAVVIDADHHALALKPASTLPRPVIAHNTAPMQNDNPTLYREGTEGSDTKDKTGSRSQQRSPERDNVGRINLPPSTTQQSHPTTKQPLPAISRRMPSPARVLRGASSTLSSSSSSSTPSSSSSFSSSPIPQSSSAPSSSSDKHMSIDDLDGSHISSHSHIPTYPHGRPQPYPSPTHIHPNPTAQTSRPSPSHQHVHRQPLPGLPPPSHTHHHPLSSVQPKPSSVVIPSAALTLPYSSLPPGPKSPMRRPPPIGDTYDVDDGHDNIANNTSNSRNNRNDTNTNYNSNDANDTTIPSLTPSQRTKAQSHPTNAGLQHLSARMDDNNSNTNTINNEPNPSHRQTNASVLLSVSPSTASLLVTPLAHQSPSINDKQLSRERLINWEDKMKLRGSNMGKRDSLIPRKPARNIGDVKATALMLGLSRIGGDVDDYQEQDVTSDYGKENTINNGDADNDDTQNMNETSNLASTTALSTNPVGLNFQPSSGPLSPTSLPHPHPQPLSHPRSHPQPHPRRFTPLSPPSSLTLVSSPTSVSSSSSSSSLHLPSSSSPPSSTLSTSSAPSHKQSTQTAIHASTHGSIHNVPNVISTPDDLVALSASLLNSVRNDTQIPSSSSASSTSLPLPASMPCPPQHDTKSELPYPSSSSVERSAKYAIPTTTKPLSSNRIVDMAEPTIPYHIASISSNNQAKGEREMMLERKVDELKSLLDAALQSNGEKTQLLTTLFTLVQPQENQPHQHNQQGRQGPSSLSLSSPSSSSTLSTSSSCPASISSSLSSSSVQHSLLSEPVSAPRVEIPDLSSSKSLSTKRQLSAHSTSPTSTVSEQKDNRTSSSSPTSSFPPTSSRLSPQQHLIQLQQQREVIRQGLTQLRDKAAAHIHAMHAPSPTNSSDTKHPGTTTHPTFTSNHSLASQPVNSASPSTNATNMPSQLLPSPSSSSSTSSSSSSSTVPISSSILSPEPSLPSSSSPSAPSSIPPETTTSMPPTIPVKSNPAPARSRVKQPRRMSYGIYHAVPTSGDEASSPSPSPSPNPSLSTSPFLIDQLQPSSPLEPSPADKGTPSVGSNNPVTTVSSTKITPHPHQQKKTIPSSAVTQLSKKPEISTQEGPVAKPKISLQEQTDSNKNSHVLPQFISNAPDSTTTSLLRPYASHPQAHHRQSQELQPSSVPTSKSPSSSSSSSSSSTSSPLLPSSANPLYDDELAQALGVMGGDGASDSEYSPIQPPQTVQTRQATQSNRREQVIKPNQTSVGRESMKINPSTEPIQAVQGRKSKVVTKESAGNGGLSHMNPKMQVNDMSMTRPQNAQPMETQADKTVGVDDQATQTIVNVSSRKEPKVRAVAETVPNTHLSASIDPIPHGDVPAILETGINEQIPETVPLDEDITTINTRKILKPSPTMHPDRAPPGLSYQISLGSAVFIDNHPLTDQNMPHHHTLTETKLDFDDSYNLDDVDEFIDSRTNGPNKDKGNNAANVQPSLSAPMTEGMKGSEVRYDHDDFEAIGDNGSVSHNPEDLSLTLTHHGTYTTTSNPVVSASIHSPMDIIPDQSHVESFQLTADQSLDDALFAHDEGETPTLQAISTQPINRSDNNYRDSRDTRQAAAPPQMTNQEEDGDVLTTLDTVVVRPLHFPRRTLSGISVSSLSDFDSIGGDMQGNYAISDQGSNGSVAGDSIDPSNDPSDLNDKNSSRPTKTRGQTLPTKETKPRRSGIHRRSGSGIPSYDRSMAGTSTPTFSSISTASKIPSGDAIPILTPRLRSVSDADGRGILPAPEKLSLSRTNTPKDMIINESSQETSRTHARDTSDNRKLSSNQAQDSNLVTDSMPTLTIPTDSTPSTSTDDKPPSKWDLLSTPRRSSSAHRRCVHGNHGNNEHGNDTTASSSSSATPSSSSSSRPGTPLSSTTYPNLPGTPRSKHPSQPFHDRASPARLKNASPLLGATNSSIASQSQHPTHHPTPSGKLPPSSARKRSSTRRNRECTNHLKDTQDSSRTIDSSNSTNSDSSRGIGTSDHVDDSTNSKMRLNSSDGSDEVERPKTNDHEVKDFTVAMMTPRLNKEDVSIHDSELRGGGGGVDEVDGKGNKSEPYTQGGKGPVRSEGVAITTKSSLDDFTEYDLGGGIGTNIDEAPSEQESNVHIQGDLERRSTSFNQTNLPETQTTATTYQQNRDLPYTMTTQRQDDNTTISPSVDVLTVSSPHTLSPRTSSPLMTADQNLPFTHLHSHHPDISNENGYVDDNIHSSHPIVTTSLDQQQPLLPPSPFDMPQGDEGELGTSLLDEVLVLDSPWDVDHDDHDEHGSDRGSAEDRRTDDKSDNHCSHDDQDHHYNRGDYANDEHSSNTCDGSNDHHHDTHAVHDTGGYDQGLDEFPLLIPQSSISLTDPTLGRGSNDVAENPSDGQSNKMSSNSISSDDMIANETHSNTNPGDDNDDNTTNNIYSDNKDTYLNEDNVITNPGTHTNMTVNDVTDDHDIDTITSGDIATTTDTNLDGYKIPDESIETTYDDQPDYDMDEFDMDGDDDTSHQIANNNVDANDDGYGDDDANHGNVGSNYGNGDDIHNQVDDNSYVQEIADLFDQHDGDSSTNANTNNMTTTTTNNITISSSIGNATGADYVNDNLIEALIYNGNAPTTKSNKLRDDLEDDSTNQNNIGAASDEPHAVNLTQALSTIDSTTRTWHEDDDDGHLQYTDDASSNINISNNIIKNGTHTNPLHDKGSISSRGVKSDVNIKNGDGNDLYPLEYTDHSGARDNTDNNGNSATDYHDNTDTAIESSGWNKNTFGGSELDVVDHNGVGDGGALVDDDEGTAFLNIRNHAYNSARLSQGQPDESTNIGHSARTLLHLEEVAASPTAEKVSEELVTSMARNTSTLPSILPSTSSTLESSSSLDTKPVESRLFIPSTTSTSPTSPSSSPSSPLSATPSSSFGQRVSHSPMSHRFTVNSNGQLTPKRSRLPQPFQSSRDSLSPISTSLTSNSAAAPEETQTQSSQLGLVPSVSTSDSSSSSSSSSSSLTSPTSQSNSPPSSLHSSSPPQFSSSQSPSISRRPSYAVTDLATHVSLSPQRPLTPALATSSISTVEHEPSTSSSAISTDSASSSVSSSTSSSSSSPLIPSTTNTQSSPLTHPSLPSSPTTKVSNHDGVITTPTNGPSSLSPSSRTSMSSTGSLHGPLNSTRQERRRSAAVTIKTSTSSDDPMMTSIENDTNNDGGGNNRPSYSKVPSLLPPPHTLAAGESLDSTWASFGNSGVDPKRVVSGIGVYTEETPMLWSGQSQEYADAVQVDDEPVMIPKTVDEDGDDNAAVDLSKTRIRMRRRSSVGLPSLSGASSSFDSIANHQSIDLHPSLNSHSSSSQQSSYPTPMIRNLAMETISAKLSGDPTQPRQPTALSLDDIRVSIARRGSMQGYLAVQADMHRVIDKLAQDPLPPSPSSSRPSFSLSSGMHPQQSSLPAPPLASDPISSLPSSVSDLPSSLSPSPSPPPVPSPTPSEIRQSIQRRPSLHPFVSMNQEMVHTLHRLEAELQRSQNISLMEDSENEEEPDSDHKDHAVMHSVE